MAQTEHLRIPVPRSIRFIEPTLSGAETYPVVFVNLQEVTHAQSAIKGLDHTSAYGRKMYAMERLAPPSRPPAGPGPGPAFNSAQHVAREAPTYGATFARHASTSTATAPAMFGMTASYQTHSMTAQGGMAQSHQPHASSSSSTAFVHLASVSESQPSQEVPSPPPPPPERRILSKADWIARLAPILAAAKAKEDSAVIDGIDAKGGPAHTAAAAEKDAAPARADKDEEAGMDISDGE